MPTVIRVQTAFDPTLPYDKPDLSAGATLRFAAADLIPGAVSSWTSTGSTAHTVAQTTTASKPSRNIVSNNPAVVFDGTNDKLTSSYSAPSTQTVYAVFKATTASKGSAQPIVNFGGIYLGLGSTGKVIAAGSAGPVQTVGAITSGTLYAACFTLNGAAATVEINGENVSGTITTIGTLNALDFANSGALYFGGEWEDAAFYPTVHGQTERTANLTKLRAWYSAT